MSETIVKVYRFQKVDDAKQPTVNTNAPFLPALRELVFYQQVPLTVHPQELASPSLLAQLETLSLHNTTTLSFPVAFHLQNIRHLKLTNTICSLAPLSLLCSLTALSLCHCAIIDIAPMPNFPLPLQLERFNSKSTIYYNSNPLENLIGRVRVLDVHVLRVMDPLAVTLKMSHVWSLSETLTDLCLMHSLVDTGNDFTDFSRLTLLQTLCLLRTPLAIPDELSLPPSLHTLLINGDWILTDTVCRKMRHIVNLTLSCNLDVWESGLSPLTKLRSLILLSPTELHPRVLPPAENLHTFKITTFMK